MESTPVVLCLSPASVVRSAYAAVRPTLGGHRWVVLEDRTAAGLLQALSSADFVVGDWTAELRLDDQALRAADRCQAVFQPTAGYQAIDIETARALGIAVTNAPGANASSVAEWAVMAMMAALRNVAYEHQALQAGDWRMVEAAEDGISDLAGKTVGILGFGAIGQRVAQRLAGFEIAEVLCFDAFPVDPDVLASCGAVQVDIDDLCRRADVLTLHVPLLPSTRGLIDRRRLELLGESAVLINTCRGAVVDEDALHEMLSTRGIRGAALDVFGDEPLRAGHRWADLSNVLLSPHLSGSTVEARSRMVGSALANLRAVLRGEDPKHVVNEVQGVPRRGSPVTTRTRA